MSPELNQMNEQNQRRDIFDELRRDRTRQRLADLIGLDMSERIALPVDDQSELDSLQVKIRFVNRKPASAKRQATERKT